MISYQTEMNRTFAGYYGPEQAHGQPEQCNLHLTVCQSQPAAPPPEKEWTVEEILAREG